MNNVNFFDGEMVKNIKTGKVYKVDHQTIGTSNTHVFVKNYEGSWFLLKADLKKA